MSFPKDFVWGAATASYQIEGAALEDGRGECIWTRFSHTPGKVANGDTGDLACDHYHRYAEDVALMKATGLQAYRFSIAWSRVLPAGRGEPNPAGLDFYKGLVDELLKADITPYITLYHWDLPQALQDEGGWENPESVKWFADYTDLMTRQLGDRVKHWITHNEPWVVAFVGNYEGRHAPGKADLPTALMVAHHLLLSHGEAISVIRSNVSEAQAGITLNVTVAESVSDRPEDVYAARRHDGYVNRWFMDPLMKGSYPADMVGVFEAHIPDELDINAISAARVENDFIGINYYTRAVVGAGEDNQPFNLQLFPQMGAEHTEMGWEVYPEGLYKIIMRLHEDYAPKAIYVTENGAAFDDPAPDGQEVVEDARRVAYLKSHFAAAGRAIEDGAPLRGYFVWSFLDNFEWAYGFDKRFGLYHIDYQTLKRTPKRSAFFYADFIRENG